MKLSKLYNPMMIWLLNSPLHGVVSKMYMVVTFTGRKSGKTYQTPVEYFPVGDDGTIGFLTQGSRIWWRNLQDGAAVTLRVRGQDVRGTSQTTLGDPDAYTAALTAYLDCYPGREKYFNARREDDGTLVIDNLGEAAAANVVVSITPDTM